MEKFTLVTFYHLVQLENYEDMRDELLSYCIGKGLKGTVLLAMEGINGSVAGHDGEVRDFLDFVRRDDRLCGLEWKESYTSFQPFQEMKVRLRKEVVALGCAELENMGMCETGEYVEPEDWTSLIAREDVKTIDIRNLYETKLGRFKYSIDPETINFRDFQDWVRRWIEKDNISTDQKIAMYCTGGIRSEKSTAYMKMIGFKNVYQLRGGIIHYLLKTKNTDGAWVGDCFVFDDRVAVNVDLEPVQLKCLECSCVVNTDDLKNIPRGRVLCSGCGQNTQFS
ncbi:rhodanese-related sulfurtransferase [Neorickettsia risticii]|nr:rhodanese-like domain-containing protein [Neorickettsia risticii]